MLNFRESTMGKIFNSLVVSTIFMATLSFASTKTNLQINELPIYQGVGGDFSLESTLEKRVALSDFNEKIVVLSFGYTNCSDVCPVTLGFINNALSKLDEEANKVQVLFVSVDPDYDTIKHLQKYLAYFNKDFIGMTGSKENIDKAVKLYNIRYSKTSDIQVSTQYRKKHIPKDLESNEHSMHQGMKHDMGGMNHNMEDMKHDTSSLFSHSTYIYLIDTNGKVRGVFDTTTPASKMAQSIQYLIRK